MTNLPNETIDQYAQRVGDETGTPEQARQLLEEFVLRWDKREPIPDVLLRHFADCLRNFLTCKRLIISSPRFETIDSLDKAFGLTRTRPGAPATDPDAFKDAAMQVLEKYLTGVSLENAWMDTADTRKSVGLPISSESQIKAAWAKHKLDAYLLLRAFRDSGTGYWTDAEKLRLKRIFAKEPWFNPPPW